MIMVIHYNNYYCDSDSLKQDIKIIAKQLMNMCNLNPKENKAIYSTLKLHLLNSYSEIISYK